MEGKKFAFASGQLAAATATAATSFCVGCLNPVRTAAAAKLLRLVAARLLSLFELCKSTVCVLKQLSFSSSSSSQLILRLPSDSLWPAAESVTIIKPQNEIALSEGEEEEEESNSWRYECRSSCLS